MASACSPPPPPIECESFPVFERHVHRLIKVQHKQIFAHGRVQKSYSIRFRVGVSGVFILWLGLETVVLDATESGCSDLDHQPTAAVSMLLAEISTFVIDQRLFVAVFDKQEWARVPLVDNGNDKKENNKKKEKKKKKNKNPDKCERAE
jgi:hypothetical protein